MLQKWLIFLFVGILIASCVNGNRLNKSGDNITKDEKETQYTIEYIFENGGKGDSALAQLIDSIDRREQAKDYRVVPKYKIEMARGFVASRALKPYLALKYLLPAWGDNTLRNNPSDYIEMASLISNEYFALHRIDESTRYIQLAIEKARSIGNMKEVGRMKANRCLLLMQSVNANALLDELREARAILRTHSDSDTDSLSIAWSYELESDILKQNGDWMGAVSVLQIVLRIYENEVVKRVMSPTDNYFSLAQTYIAIAEMYAEEGKNDQADAHYAKWKYYSDGAEKIISVQMYSTVMNYYILRKMVNEALLYSSLFEREMAAADSMSIASCLIKSHMSELYELKGNLAEALKYAKEARRVSDTLQQRSNLAAALEMTAVYELTEKQEQIVRQNAKISRHNLTLVSLLGLILLLCIFAITMWRNNQRIRMKNRILFRQIKELGVVRRELSRLRERLDWSIEQLSNREPKDISEENALFTRIEECMKKQQLFLNPKLSRDMLAAELGTNRTYLSNAIYQGCALTFGEYLNRLRLDYAKEFLLDNTEVKVEIVATMAGFNSVRTFYRLFHDIYGITPTEYRNIDISDLVDNR